LHTGLKLNKMAAQIWARRALVATGIAAGTEFHVFDCIVFVEDKRVLSQYISRRPL
jgi:hypothetical protein